MEGMKAHCGLRNQRGHAKAPRLDELLAFFEIPAWQIREATGRLFGENGVNSHDARYDVTATYLCYRRALQQGLME